jgi:hypothetical protein
MLFRGPDIAAPHIADALRERLRSLFEVHAIYPSGTGVAKENSHDGIVRNGERAENA